MLWRLPFFGKFNPKLLLLRKGNPTAIRAGLRALLGFIKARLLGAKRVSKLKLIKAAVDALEVILKNV